MSEHNPDTKALRKRTDEATMLEMRLARDLKRFTAERERGLVLTYKAQRPERETKAIRVVLSVRRRDAGGVAYGPTTRWQYVAKGEISTLAAEVDARKKAREDGYVVWAVLDIMVIESAEV